jgi:hypothetical protein
LPIWKQEKASTGARSKADELVKRVKAGEKVRRGAKALGLDAKPVMILPAAQSLMWPAENSLGAAFQLKPGMSARLLNLAKLARSQTSRQARTQSRGF